MADDKQIKIGIDSSGVASGVNDAKSKIQEMYAEMERIALSRNTRSKDILRDIEEQIKAQQRLNAEYEKTTGADLRSDLVNERRRGAITSKQFTEYSEELDKDKRDKEGLVEALRELTATLKKEAREEIRNDEEGVRSRLSGKKYEDMTLEERVQADELRVRNDRDGRGAQSGILRYGGAAANLDVRGLAQNGASDMMSMGGALGVAGAIAAVSLMAGKAIFDKMEDYGKGTRGSRAITGQDYDGVGLDYGKYGMSGAEFTKRIGSMSRRRLSGDGATEATYNQMLLERGIGLDQNMFSDMERLSMVNGGTGMTNTLSSISAMRGGGIVKGQDMSAVPDYLAIIANLSKEQLSKLGKVDIGINSKMVAALASMDENLQKSPEALATMMNAVKGGLSSSSSPQTEALQYSVLSKIAPGADMFELMKMKEDPFSQSSQQYLPKYLEQIKKMSGGKSSDFYMNLMSQFGLSASMAETLGKGFESGDLKNTLKKNFTPEGAQINAEERAKNATTIGEVWDAEKVNTLVSATKQVADLLSTLVSETTEGKVVNNKIADNLEKNGQSFWANMLRIATSNPGNL